MAPPTAARLLLAAWALRGAAAVPALQTLATLPPPPSLPTLPPLMGLLTLTTSAPFDCGGSVDDWPAVMLSWCCENEKRGCPSTATTAEGAEGTTTKRETATTTAPADEASSKATAATEVPTIAATVRFDCLTGKAQAWSSDKARWCCEHERRGCPSAGTAATESTTAPPRSSSTEAARMPVATLPPPILVTIASPETTSTTRTSTSATATTVTTTTPEATATKTSTATTTRTTTGTTTTATSTSRTSTTTTNPGCNTSCTIHGMVGSTPQVGTCKVHIQRIAYRDFLGDPRSCLKARDLVLQHCPECSVCAATGAGCGLLEPITTKTPPRAKGVKPCDVSCVLAGQAAKCGGRMLWASTNSFAGNPQACSLAGHLVHQQCQACGECTPDDAGCPTGHGSAKKFDCEAGRATGWPSDKREWCCKHESRGCPTTTTTTSAPYDCHAGLSNFAKGWSKAKKGWCCKHKDLGCEASIEVLKKFGSVRGPPKAEHGSTHAKVPAAVAAVAFLGLSACFVTARWLSRSGARRHAGAQLLADEPESLE